MMSASFAKSLPRFLWLLLFLAHGRALAQTEDDSTFNGIDYYFSRIAKGFGGGFKQEVGDKEQGTRNFLTAPFLYGSTSDRLSLRLSNSTNWTKWEGSARQNNGVEKSTSYTTNLEAQGRPTTGLWLFGRGNFSKQKLDWAEISEFENETRSIFLQGSYLSHGGRIQLTPKQLRWEYYSEPSQLLLDLPVDRLKFISRGQSMFYYTGGYEQTRASEFRPPDSFSYSRHQFSSKQGYIDLNFSHAVTNQLMIGLSLLPGTERRSEDYIYPDNEQHENSKSQILQFTPQVNYIGIGQTQNQLDANFSFSESDYSTRGRLPTGPQAQYGSTGSSKGWRFNYTLQRLWNVDVPSLEAFLANWNEVFGNRLPQQGFHFIGQFSASGSETQNENSVGIGMPTSETRFMGATITTLYGLLDWLEVGWRVYHFNSRSTMETNAPGLPSTSESSGWYNTVALNFANYRYEKRFKSRFGWEEIDDFDRLHGPLLLSGMIKGVVMLRRNASDTEVRGDYSYNGLDRSWSIVGQVRYGIRDNFEARLQGSYWKQQFEFEGEAVPALTERLFMAALVWQPWASIRFQIGRGIRPLLSSQSLFGTNANDVWTFQVLSLF